MWGLLQGWLQLFLTLALGAGMLVLLATGMIVVGMLLLPLIVWIIWQVRKNRQPVFVMRTAEDGNTAQTVITVDYEEVDAAPSGSERQRRS